MFTRFRFHFRAASSQARRRGIEKQRAFSCVRSYTQTPNRHARRSSPATSNCFPNRSLVAKIHASCIRGCLATLCRWEGARWLGVWDARPGSAQRAPQWVWERYGESVPLLLSRRTIGPKRTPPMSTGLQAIDSEILMKSCPTWWAGSPNCPRHPATAQVRPSRRP
jgi:hypothetical protein